MKKQVVLVLGGTVPHISLVKKLKLRGYYTILVDYLDNPPAKEYADEHIKESTLDNEKITEIARERNAIAVLATCVDQANVTCCYAAEKLGLPHPYSYQTALNVTDKVRMKEIMWNNNIPTSKYVHVSCFEDALSKSLRYPLIVKPADSNSANGVKKVLNENELKEYLPLALKFSRNGFAIVEEFISGREISAYSVVVDGKAHLLMVQERLSCIEGSENTIKCYGSYTPARITAAAKSKIEPILTQIAQAFHLDNTPLFFQGIVDGDDISIIEFAPRVGGGISSKTIKFSSKFDIIDAAIDSYFCKKISLDGYHPQDKHFAVNQIYGSNGVYDHTTGIDLLLSENLVENISFYKKKGDNIDDSRASTGRIGVMVFSANSDSEIRSKIKKAFNTIDCFDNNGNSIIRRDLNLSDLWDL